VQINYLNKEIKAKQTQQGGDCAFKKFVAILRE
jgi:hypothetical protein